MSAEGRAATRMLRPLVSPWVELRGAKAAEKENVMRSLTSRITLMVLLLGVIALGMGSAVHAQDYAKLKEGESVFTDATPTLLAAGAIPTFPHEPSGIALQRGQSARGGLVVTPAVDPRLVLLTVEQGTLTVRNTVPVVVTRQTGAPESVPAATEFTMTTGDAYVSPASSGGQLRNTGTEEVILLAAIIYPDPAATPTP